LIPRVQCTKTKRDSTTIYQEENKMTTLPLVNNMILDVDQTATQNRGFSGLCAPKREKGLTNGAETGKSTVPFFWLWEKKKNKQRARTVTTNISLGLSGKVKRAAISLKLEKDECDSSSSALEKNCGGDGEKGRQKISKICDALAAYLGAEDFGRGNENEFKRKVHR